MSRITSFIKIPNYFDVILLVLLASRIFLRLLIDVKVNPYYDFGYFAEDILIGPFGWDFTNATPLDLLFWFGYRWEGVFFLAVLALVLAGFKKAAAIVAISATLCTSILVPFVRSISTSDFFYSFPMAYNLSGQSYDAELEEFFFDGGLYFMQQLRLGFGLVLLLAYCVFYLVRQYPRKAKEARTAQQVSDDQAVTTKADFCPKCGNEASDGDFCAKCGNSLLVVSGQAGQSRSYPAGRTSPLAIASIITVFFVSWVGILLGYLARKEIRASNGQLSGEGLAKAAIIIGWVATGLGVLVAIIWAVAIGIAAGNSYSY